MSSTPLETQRPLPSMFMVAWLVIAFAFRRSINRLQAFTKKKRPPTGSRSATARKTSASGILVAVFSLIFLFNGVTQSTRLVHQVAIDGERRANAGVVVVDKWTMRDLERAETKRSEDANSQEWRDALRGELKHRAFDEGLRDQIEKDARASFLVEHFEKHGKAGFRETRFRSFAFLPSSSIWYGDGGSAEMLVPLSFIALLLAIGVALMSIAGPNQDLSKVEWTFEWWFTFPVPARGLLLARVLETAIADPFAWFMLFPFFSVIFWCAGYSWFAIPLGLASMTYVGILAGSMRVAAETTLRRFLALRNVARLQAVLSTVSFIPLLAAIATVSPEWLATVTGVAKHFPSWALVNPIVPIGIAAGGSQAWAAVIGCLVFAIVVTMGATTVGGWMLRDGLTTSAGPNQGLRQRAARVRENRGIALGTVTRKELHLLFRDRTLFTQAFVVPALIVGMQLFMNRGLLSALAANPRHAAAMAFGTAGFVLATGACNTLVMDVPALWIYFTVPKSLDRILIHKAVLWSCLASSIAVVVFVVVTRADPAVLLAGTPVFALALVGVVLNAFIATGIGVLGTDALETEPRRRIKVAMVYLYMVLASMFAYALYAPSAWAKFAQVVLSALLAYALWQKVRDHTPFLLDPNEAPAPSIAVADGVIAALAFFVLQGIFTLCFIAFDCSMGASLLFAFAGAGLVIGVVTLFIFWRSGVPELFTTLGFCRPENGVARGVLIGVAGGLTGGLLACGYLLIVDHVEVLRRLRDETVSLSSGDAVLGPWLAVLAIVAAPLFEEFIFRAVLYGGFRRSLSPMRAMVFSALVFAIVHPAIATAPVFVLGVIAALVYERSRSLLAPIAAHMTYNAIVVGLALWRP